jgi:hypothetical protein
VARLIRAFATSLVLGVAIAALPIGSATAQEASPSPTPRPPTCAERFPAEGPAGVDLRLGCIVSEIVGLYTTSSQAEPPTLSAYAVMVLAGIGVGVVLVGHALRLLRRSASRRLASVTPGEWWICPACASINALGTSRCYACGGPPGDGPTLPTGDAPGQV